MKFIIKNLKLNKIIATFDEIEDAMLCMDLVYRPINHANDEVIYQVESI